MLRRAEFTSLLCLTVVCSWLALLWAPTCAKVDIASAAGLSSAAEIRLASLMSEARSRLMSDPTSSMAQVSGPGRAAASDSSREVAPAGLATPSHAAFGALGAGVPLGAFRSTRVHADELALLRTAASPPEGPRPEALGRRMGLQDEPLSERVAPGRQATPEPEHAAARMGRGAGGMGGSGTGPAVSSAGQGGPGTAVLPAVHDSPDGAGYRLARAESRPAALEAQVRPLVRPG